MASDNIDEIVTFETLNDYPNYEIATTYPFIIRNKKTKHVLKENIYNYNNTDGYPRIKINNKVIRKHILIAKQFIQNDDPQHLTEIDHINHDRTDYHIENLRWVNHSLNCINKSANRSVKYHFIDDIPEDSAVVDFYKTENGYHTFDENRYYFYHDEENNEDKFYGKTSESLYKVLHVNIAKGGKRYVSLQDRDNKRVSVYIDKYRYQHDL